MVTVINRLTVSGDVAEFESIIGRITEYMASQPGFLSHRLYRSRNDPRVYVEAADWTDAESHRTAMSGSGFRENVVALGAVAAAEPDVFEEVRDES